MTCQITHRTTMEINLSGTHKWRTVGVYIFLQKKIDQQMMENKFVQLLVGKNCFGM